MNLKTLRYTIWIVAAVAGIAVGVLYKKTKAPETSAVEIKESAIKPVFTLTDHTGAEVTQETYKGKWLLVFFGFTHCPDICPTALSDMAQVMNKLGDDAENLVPLFITVDPERDTVDIMAQYVEMFHPGLVGLTGSKEQADATAENFRAYRSRVEDDNAPDGYMMDHSAFFYLINPEGQFAAPFSDEDTVDDMVKDIRQRL